MEYPGPQHAISTMATTSASGKGVPASTTTEAASAGAKAHARPRKAQIAEHEQVKYLEI